LKIEYERPVVAVVADLLWFVEYTRRLEDYNEKMPRFLYVLPPRAENRAGYYEMEEEKRGELCAAMREEVSDYVDLDYVELTGDGVHFAVVGHEDVARRVAEKVREMLGERG
jgi:lysophospholipase L1-like esterase